MSDSSVTFAPLDEATLRRVADALHEHEAESGPMEIDEEGIMARGDRHYVPVRPKDQPKSIFSFFEAVAGAEVQLRNEGIDVLLTPEYPQPYVVVAEITATNAKYLYLSRDGDEYEDLGRLLGIILPTPGSDVEIEGFPYDGPEDRERATEEVRAEHPTATLLGELAQSH